MVEIEQVIQWLRDGGQEEPADLLSQCAMTVEWVDILFDMAGNREFNLVDVKIEAPHRIISEIGDTLASQAEQIEKAVQGCMRTVDCVVRSIDWVPKLPDISPVKATPQIFLCYAREDEEKVEKLYQKLSDTGFKPWMAKKDLVGGERWKSRISQAIRRSDLFLACLSANSIDKRGWVQREIKDALDTWQEMLESDIYLIPVRLEDGEVPERLREFQWVDLFEDDGWTQLVKAIQVGMERRAETPIESIAKTVETEPVQTSVSLATAAPALQKTYTLTPSRTPRATQRSVTRIGDTIPEVGLAKKDLSMTLIGWAESDIAVKGPYAGNELYTFTARPRMKFIILEFEFHNNWVRQQKTPYFDKGEVRTDKGYFYRVWSPLGGIHSKEYAPRPSTQEEVENLGGSGAFEDLLPEESVRGHVVFEIPEDEEPEEVELSQVPVPIKLD